MHYGTRIFYKNKKLQSIKFEYCISEFSTYEEFEKAFPEEFLEKDSRVEDYLAELLYACDKQASKLSFEAHLAHSYVGNIINGKKDNPSRDASSRIIVSCKEDVMNKYFINECKYGISDGGIACGLVEGSVNASAKFTVNGISRWLTNSEYGEIPNFILQRIL